MDRLPEELQVLKFVSPLVIVIEQSRLVLFEGVMPEWDVFGVYSAISLIMAGVGFYFLCAASPLLQM